MDMTHFGAMLHSFWTAWLVVLFLGIVGYAMWPRNREHFEHASRIPFNDDGQEG
ncbi:MAG: CcoQ/FixQ family Cbb3-type cytochrome c oxidase assembly chaperone [Azospirillum sp.]|nr:CcoQ/FixQ family Cbb3-type cytochrome c oxidase assembly chaperone [Azospirillum sp.]